MIVTFTNKSLSPRTASAVLLATGLVGTVLLSACSSRSSNSVQADNATPAVETTAAVDAAPAGEPANLVQVALDVPGLDCAGCSLAIRIGLTKVDGVEDVTGDPETRSAVVRYDPEKTNPDALIKAVKEIGFDATVSEADQTKKKTEGGGR